MGGPASQMLAMAGVGRAIIAHGGKMISPDLNRQVLGSEAVIGKPRAADFAAYLRTMNRFVQVEAIDHEPDDLEAMELARRCDGFSSHLPWVIRNCNVTVKKMDGPPETVIAVWRPRFTEHPLPHRR